MFFLFTMTAQS